MTLNSEEECPATPPGFQHISEILPAVLAAIVQQAAVHQDDLDKKDRVYRWAA